MPGSEAELQENDIFAKKHGKSLSWAEDLGATDAGPAGTLYLADLLNDATEQALLATAEHGSGPERAKTAKSTDLTVLIVGDSYSTPFSPLYDAIDARLNAGGLDVDLVSKARGGAALADGAKQLKAGLKGGVDAVLVLLGSNDGLDAGPIDAAERSLDKLLSKLDAKGIPTLVAGTYGQWPIQNAGYADADDAQRFEAIFGRQAEKHGDILFPGLLDGAYGVPGRTEDGEHPSEEGARIIVDRMAGALDQLISQAL